MKSFGCSSFALLFDDIEAELNADDTKVFDTQAQAQCKVTNDIFKHVQPTDVFMFCPTGALKIYPSLFSRNLCLTKLYFHFFRVLQLQSGSRSRSIRISRNNRQKFTRNDWYFVDRFDENPLLTPYILIVHVNHRLEINISCVVFRRVRIDGCDGAHHTGAHSWNEGGFSPTAPHLGQPAC